MTGLKRFLILLLFLLIPSSSFAEIQFDNINSSSINQSADHTTTSLTISNEPNRIVVTVTATENGGAVTSCTFNGVNQNYLTTVTNSISKIEIWYSFESDLPVGGTYNTVCTYTNTGLSVYYITGVLSFTGVLQEGTLSVLSTNTNTSNPAITTSLTTASNAAWIVDGIVAADDGSFTASGANQTERFDTNVGATVTAAGSTRGPISPEGATNFTWTHSDVTNSRLAHLMVQLKPFISGTIINNATQFNSLNR